MLTQEVLKELLRYNRASGIFTWRVRPNARIAAGSVAGAVKSTGYTYISIKRTKYAAHRLAWLYVHGHLPVEYIDHINGVRTDNRLRNLRAATNAENQWNCRVRSDNTSGHKGVSLHPPTGTWYARGQLNGVRHHLGYFDTAEEAAAAYAAFAARSHGKFCNLNLSATL